LIPGPKPSPVADKKAFLDALAKALLASKLVSYAQGFMLMKEAAKENEWNLNYGGIALMWRGGCIIRSAFLGKIKEAYDKNPGLKILFWTIISGTLSSTPIAPGEK
jgi:6-phosphogluconate dehydrogenase